MRPRTLIVALAFVMLAAGAGPRGDASSLVFAGIRPGTWMTAPSLCTMNFIFSATGTLDGDGPLYIGTAKHCVVSSINEDPRGKPVQLAVALGAVPPVLVEAGTVAWVTKGDIAIGNDYALVRIASEYRSIVSPSIAVIGGPTAVSDGTPGGAVAMTGHGAGLGTGGTPRAGVISSYPFSGGVGMWMPVIAGDSGAPVRTADGAALGEVTDDGTNRVLRYGETPLGTALGSLVSRVTAQTGLRVVTCASLMPWPGFGCPPDPRP